MALLYPSTSGREENRGLKEQERSWQVKMPWLAVNADAMNVDNKPRDDFEKDAVKALASGRH